jgi:short-subunit dehydrogenase
LKNPRVEKLDLLDPYEVAYAHTWDIDVLFNNADISECGCMSEIPVDLVRRNLETSVFAPIGLTQGFICKWIEAKKEHLRVVPHHARRRFERAPDESASSKGFDNWNVSSR